MAIASPAAMTSSAWRRVVTYDPEHENAMTSFATMVPERVALVALIAVWLIVSAVVVVSKRLADPYLFVALGSVMT